MVIASTYFIFMWAISSGEDRDAEGWDGRRNQGRWQYNLLTFAKGGKSWYLGHHPT